MLCAVPSTEILLCSLPERFFVMAYWIIGPTGSFADSFVSMNDTIFMNLLKAPQGKPCLDGCARL